VVIVVFINICKVHGHNIHKKSLNKDYM